ncbi:MAG TPA: Ldh family oxidoreductase, partial [Thermomicrobiales bacterium]|nr:Ldh family oxidoreductase [Thermomicrobiales bacterium]
MNGKNDTVVCDPEALQTFAGRILAGAGTPDDIAAVVAEDLVDANLAGHDSHGVIRVPQYVKAIADGEIRPTGRATAVADRGATAVVSGEWGFGQASGRFASDLAVERAHCYGVAAVALIRCNHLGRIGAFMERISAGGCVGMMWVGGIGGAHQAVPFGGAKPAYGANPLAAGVPLPSGDPFILDIATTAVAGGKVMVAYDRGEPVPPGTIVDRAGNPTTDPAALLDGGA